MTTLSTGSEVKLDLSQAAIDFLQFVEKNKSKLAHFTIGQNKLNFYGILDVMATHSELIKFSLDIYADSPQPYPLLTFGVVLERPMTLLWLELNGVPELRLDNHNLPIIEWLHMYRIMSYLGMDLKIYPVTNVLRNFIDSGEDEKLDKKNQDTMVRILNSAFDSGIVHDAGLSMSLFQKINKNYPDIAKEIKYIPVYVNDKFVSYTSRKPVGKYVFISHATKNLHFTDVGTGEYLSYFDDGHWSLSLTIDVWGPDSIKIKYTTYLGRPYLRKTWVRKEPPSAEELFYPVIN
jgi:hypothetical protein